MKTKAAVWVAAGAVFPAGAWLAGFPAWALGLWIGEALGLGLFFWIRRSVCLAFEPNASRPARKKLLWHSGLRLGVVAATLFCVIKIPALSLGAVIVGYTLVQIPAMLLEIRGLSREVLRERHS